MRTGKPKLVSIKFDCNWDPTGLLPSLNICPVCNREWKKVYIIWMLVPWEKGEVGACVCEKCMTLAKTNNGLASISSSIRRITYLIRKT